MIRAVCELCRHD
jgi:CCR4-NOT transcription complex subunit 1